MAGPQRKLAPQSLLGVTMASGRDQRFDALHRRCIHGAGAVSRCAPDKRAGR
jgi:hypothetical protein